MTSVRVHAHCFAEDVRRRKEGKEGMWLKGAVEGRVAFKWFLPCNYLFETITPSISWLSNDWENSRLLSEDIKKLLAQMEAKE